MREAGRHGRRVREQGDSLAGQRPPQLRVLDESVNPEFHSARANESGWWKSGVPAGCLSAQYETAPETLSTIADTAIDRVPSCRSGIVASTSSLSLVLRTDNSGASVGEASVASR